NGSGARLTERLSEFDAIAIFDERGVAMRSAGVLPADFRPTKFASALEQGRTVLARAESAPTTLLMVRPVATEDGTRRIVVAALKAERLWGEPDTLPSMTDFCVATASGVLLNCSHPVKLPQLNWSDLSRGGARMLSWSQGSEQLRASAWAL